MFSNYYDRFELLFVYKINFQSAHSYGKIAYFNALMEKEKRYTLLEKAYKKYNHLSFIENDPICIPHLLSKKQDIEIMAFWISMLAWGNRTSIINSGHKLLDLMDGAPHQFVTQHQDTDLLRFKDFKHRTFNFTDTLAFIHFFNLHFQKNASLETAFSKYLCKEDITVENTLIGFHNYFFSMPDMPERTRKHIATPLRGSTCKRMNMFLRWMVRPSTTGVDFGLWKKIKPSQLLCPLDIHVERKARILGLLHRPKTDWLAVLELTENLRAFDANDPVKYDFALFGLGVTGDTIVI